MREKGGERVLVPLFMHVLVVSCMYPDQDVTSWCIRSCSNQLSHLARARSLTYLGGFELRVQLHSFIFS